MPSAAYAVRIRSATVTPDASTRPPGSDRTARIAGASSLRLTDATSKELKASVSADGGACASVAAIVAAATIANDRILDVSWCFIRLIVGKPRAVRCSVLRRLVIKRLATRQGTNFSRRDQF